MREFKLDRSAFKAHTAKAAAIQIAYYQGTSWQDRLGIAAYLNSVAFNYDINDPPRLDRSKFRAQSVLRNGEYLQS